jgi:hypothetical protein
MVFNATFNNISIISWQSALQVKETGLPEENLNIYPLQKFYQRIGIFFRMA